MKKAKGIKNHSTHVPPRRKQGDFGGIKVAVRFRPLTDTERKRGETSVWGVDEANNVGVIYKGNFSPKYHYDTVFQQDKDNQFVYEAIASEIVSKAMGGINGTIFAYGVTSSGKTHTMFGSKGEMGIIQRAIKHVFELIEQSPGNEYLLRLSMLEIYNEKLNDLLDPTQTNLKIMEDKTKSVHVESLTDVLLESVEQALTLIETGNANRTMNVVSSKNETRHSHTLCRISIEVNGKTVSYLNLVDVASSDSARDASLGSKTDRSFNNKSLLTLRIVICMLSNSKKGNIHIPFRDGKLTRLLRSQLTGAGDRVAMICCISPASSQKRETLNTLKFASQVEKIECKEKEEEMSQEPLADYYQHETAKLKTQLKQMSEKATAASETANHALDLRLQEELTNMRERLEEELHARMQREDDRLALNRRIDRLTRLILHSTRAQTDHKIPVYKLSRSQSCNALMKAQSNFEDYAQRGFPSDMNTSFPEDLNPPPSSSNRRSFCSEMNNSFNSGETRQDCDLGSQVFRDELIEVRKAMADKERELELKNRETDELRKKLALYEGANPSTARSIASEDDGTLKYLLLDTDRDHLEDSLTVMKKEKEQLAEVLQNVRIELKKLHKKIRQYERGTFLNEKLPLRNDGFVRSFSQSPSASTSTTESKLSGIKLSLESPHSVDEKPPCPPLDFVSKGDGPLESFDNSPMASIATNDSKFSGIEFSSECPHSIDEKPPCPSLKIVSEGDGPMESFRYSPTPSIATIDSKCSATPFCLEDPSEEDTSLSPLVLSISRGIFDQQMSSAEKHGKVERLASEARNAFEQSSTKERQIEIQRSEIVTYKDETVAIREQLRNLAAENERPKMQMSTMTSRQNREKELELKNREIEELKKKLALYERTNPRTAQSIASEDDGTLEYLLLKTDRDLLDDSLTVMKKEKRILVDRLLRVKIDLKRTQKKLQEYESGSCSTERQPLRENGPSGSYPQSPTASVSTIDSKLSAAPFSLERSAMEDRPPHRPLHSVSGSSSDQPMSSAEMHAQVERLASEVRNAFEQLAAKERQIETQRSEIVTFKDGTVAIREQLRNLAAKNERLKMQMGTMTSEQDREKELE